MRHACRLGIDLCNDGHPAAYIACQVISLLENSDLTNAGYGSNLTRNETVQCDAGLMDNRSNFAAVGCIENIRNPIKVAYELLKSQAEDHFGLVPPVLLVGQGARQWAAERGISIVSNSELISECALRTYQDNTKKVLAQCRMNQVDEKEIHNCCEQGLPDFFELDPQDKKISTVDDNVELNSCCNRKKTFSCRESLSESLHHRRKRNSGYVINDPQLPMGCKKHKGSDNFGNIGDKMDTVGAICVDKYGNVCAAVSSGGLILKQSGRVGQAACYGCGCFVAGREIDDRHVICASSTSGCGEHLIKTLLAKHCVETLLAEFDKDMAEFDSRLRMGNNCKDSSAENFEVPVCSTVVDGKSDCILQDTCCIMGHHTFDLCKSNEDRCRKSDIFHNYCAAVPSLLDQGFLKSLVLRDLDRKIAGCINIRLIKQLSHINKSTSTKKPTLKGMGTCCIFITE